MKHIRLDSPYHTHNFTRIPHTAEAMTH
ncbi:hypothetical protein BVI434_500028 [Burkholderia vietnamiensis]|nr:hypothetical protein BVI1335_1230020 [Burkholderia vietnamiensis]CAG9227607.1 hypothetical protein BVI434_500028 [Burkholderia vietnamiensis]